MKIRVGGLAVLLVPFFVFPGVGAAQEGTSLTGRVLDQRSEEPVPAARVELVEAVRGSVGSATTDADGRFRFERLAPGSYRLRASSLGYETVRTPEIPIEAGDTTEVIVWMDVEAVPVAPLQVVVGRPRVIRHPGVPACTTGPIRGSEALSFSMTRSRSGVRRASRTCSSPSRASMSRRGRSSTHGCSAAGRRSTSMVFG